MSVKHESVRDIGDQSKVTVHLPGIERGGLAFLGQRYRVAPASLREELPVGVIDREVRHIKHRLADHPSAITSYVRTFLVIQRYLCL